MDALGASSGARIFEDCLGPEIVLKLSVSALLIQLSPPIRVRRQVYCRR